MNPTVAVLDYGSGNVRSALRALEEAGASVELTADPDTVMAADGLVVPGVGAFQAVMSGIRAIKGDRLIERRLSGGRPVLGICVGLQIMFEAGEERGHHTGLSQWPGTVTRLDAPIVPHMGWSAVETPKESTLFSGIEKERFYFVHSYGVVTDPAAALAADESPFDLPRVTWTTHGQRFVAAVENGPLCATQFHPEKSGTAGIQLLRNWIGSF